MVARRHAAGVHVGAQREEGLDHAPRAAHLGPRRAAHDRHPAGRVQRRALVAGRRVARVHQPHPRRALRRQGRVVAGAAQDRALRQPTQRRELGVRPPAARVRGARRRRRATDQPDARPVPARRGELAGRFVRHRHRRRAPRRVGPRPQRSDLYVVSLDTTGRDADHPHTGIRAHRAHRHVPLAVGVARRSAGRVPRRRRPARLPAERPRSA